VGCLVSVGVNVNVGVPVTVMDGEKLPVGGMVAVESLVSVGVGVLVKVGVGFMETVGDTVLKIPFSSAPH